MATHSGILPGESLGQKSLAGYSPQGCKESDMTEATQHAHTQTYLFPNSYKTMDISAKMFQNRTHYEACLLQCKTTEDTEL